MSCRAAFVCLCNLASVDMCMHFFLQSVDTFPTVDVLNGPVY